MEIRYDEDLVEAAVTLCAAARPPAGPDEGGGATSLSTPHPLQIARFHREREKLYAILDPDERNAAFFRLHLEWFREWGLERGLTAVLDEFPLLSAALSVLAFRLARRPTEEGAELYVNDAGQRTGVLALRATRLVPTRGRATPAQTFSQQTAGGPAAGPTELGRFLRHEFTHLQDMLDPAFAYSPDLSLAGGCAAPQRLVLERYRLLWDITIDGRLAAAGHLPLAAQEKHRTDFTRVFHFWPATQQAEVFARLWHPPRPRHDELLALATDPRGWRQAAQPIPGAPCPLCGFPTFDWKDAYGLAAELLAGIQADFPQWQPAQGLCGRCLEIYRHRSAVPLASWAGQ